MTRLVSDCSGPCVPVDIWPGLKKRTTPTAKDVSPRDSNGPRRWDGTSKLQLPVGWFRTNVHRRHHRGHRGPRRAPTHTHTHTGALYLCLPLGRTDTLGPRPGDVFVLSPLEYSTKVQRDDSVCGPTTGREGVKSPRVTILTRHTGTVPGISRRTGRPWFRLSQTERELSL